jgi:signal transduction histidine kinase
MGLARRWKGVVLAVVLGGLLPTAGALVAHAVDSGPMWVEAPLHSTLEAAGAVTALFLTALVFAARSVDEADELLRATPALVSMAVLDLAHACAPAGNAFVWLHTAATLAGGLLFALVWLPPPSTRAAAVACGGAGALGVAVAVASIAAPQAFPAMLTSSGGFTRAARELNAAAGVLFWVAAAGFFRLHVARRRAEYLALGSVCLLLGVTGVLFPMSELWDADRWVWHIVRLAAYGVAAAYTHAVWRSLQRDLRGALVEIRALNAGLERRVAARTAELEAANAELESFSYSVSHDLRAPLRAIAGFSQAVIEDCGPGLGARGAADLARVRAAATRMGELIDALLVLSRVGRTSLRVAPVDLGELARSILEDLEAAEPARRVDVVVAPELEVRGDPDLLRAALQNLLENAWKFTSRRERARIELGVEPGDGEGQVHFVRDNGIGFDMEYASKLFAPFQRFHSAKEFPGTGIGLATVHRIVQRHGGRVWLESRPGEGTTVRFTLG